MPPALLVTRGPCWLQAPLAPLVHPDPRSAEARARVADGDRAAVIGDRHAAGAGAPVAASEHRPLLRPFGAGASEHPCRLVAADDERAPRPPRRRLVGRMRVRRCRRRSEAWPLLRPRPAVADEDPGAAGAPAERVAADDGRRTVGGEVDAAPEAASAVRRLELRLLAPRAAGAHEDPRGARRPRRAGCRRSPYRRLPRGRRWSRTTRPVAPVGASSGPCCVHTSPERM